MSKRFFPALFLRKTLIEILSIHRANHVRVLLEFIFYLLFTTIGATAYRPDTLSHLKTI